MPLWRAEYPQPDHYLASLTASSCVGLSGFVCLAICRFCVYHRPLLTGDGFASASVPLLILALAALAWSQVHLYDVVHIVPVCFSFRAGLTYVNPGESPVEGYTTYCDASSVNTHQTRH